MILICALFINWLNMLRGILFISFLFMGLSVSAQRVFDRRYYNLQGKVEPISIERPLLQFQVRFSAVALMSDRSPIYYRLRLVLPLKKKQSVRKVVVNGDSLCQTTFIARPKTTQKRSLVNRLWVYKNSFYLLKQQLSIHYSQSLVRGKIEIRRMPVSPKKAYKLTEKTPGYLSD
jgi:hypothetical protein